MRELIQAIQTHLQNGLGYVREADVFVTPHVDFLPDAAKFPAVGIKDGAIQRRELAGGVLEFTLDVTVIPWVQLRKSADASIMGDPVNDQKGVLEMAEDVHALLDENLLGLDGMIEAFCPTESESELFMEESGGLQKKNITYRYVREVERP
jgi:hypothetical protein